MNIKFPRFVKKLIIYFFDKIGFKDVSKDGILTTLRNIIFTKAGRENGPVRELWVENTLTQIPRGKSILDAGAGELKYKKFCSHLNYTSQDFGKYDGHGTGEGIQVGEWDNSRLDIISDIIKIPVPDKSFDVILCTEVFEHIPEPALAVKEFSRIVRPGGKVIITAPFCSMTHFAPYYFANGFSKYWYEKILPENGFEIQEISYNGNYFKYLAQEIKNVRIMASRYAGIDTRWWIPFRFAEVIILNALSRLSRKDKGSHELLCFGLHVVAKKIDKK